MLIIFHNVFSENRRGLLKFCKRQLVYSIRETAYHNIFFVFSYFSKHMENHKVVKLNTPKPNIEKNHCHHHQQQQQHHNEAWGTWEELLLSCAMNRHGFKDCEAIAIEVQSHTTPLLTTMCHYEQKFHDLCRRGGS